VTVPAINANTGADYYDIYLQGNPNTYRTALDQIFGVTNQYCALTAISVEPIASGTSADYLSSDGVSYVSVISSLTDSRVEASIPSSDSFTYFYEFRFKGLANGLAHAFTDPIKVKVTNCD